MNIRDQHADDWHVGYNSQQLPPRETNNKLKEKKKEKTNKSWVKELEADLGKRSHSLLFSSPHRTIVAAQLSAEQQTFRSCSLNRCWREHNLQHQTISTTV